MDASSSKDHGTLEKKGLIDSLKATIWNNKISTGKLKNEGIREIQF